MNPVLRALQDLLTGGKKTKKLQSGTRDNQITNRMVDRRQLPENQRENIPQRPLQRLMQAGNLGATDNQVQGGGLNPVDPQFGAVGRYNQMQNIQGGNFMPSITPVQPNNLRYRQGPQPTQSWYDF